jgi:hypothetical protein
MSKMNQLSKRVRWLAPAVAAVFTGAMSMPVHAGTIGSSLAALASGASAGSDAGFALSAGPSDIPADGVELDINTSTGDVQINGNNATLLTSIVLTSPNGDLIGGTTFTPAFTALFNTSASNTNGLIDEFNTFTNGSAVNGPVDMGVVFNTAVTNLSDITFQFSEKGINRGSLQTGAVVVPEPASLSVLGIASAGLLIRKRKRQAKA